MYAEAKTYEVVCGCRPNGSFMLLSCTKEQGISICFECKNFPCGKTKKVLAGSYEKMRKWIRHVFWKMQV